MRRISPSARFRMLLGCIWLLIAPFLSAASPDTNRDLSIQLKWYPQFQFAGYYAAKHQGLYRAEGLAVTLKPGGPGIDPVAEVLSGRAQFGIGDADLLLARAKGEPIVVLAAVFQHSPYIVLSRAEEHLAKPSDLIGKTVMALEDQGAAQLRAMLLAKGITPTKVHIIRHSWDLQDLASGKVDGMTAYATVEPYQLEKLGITPGIMRPSDYGIDFYGDCLFTTEEEIRRHPDEVEAVLRATQGGWMEAMRNPDEVIPWILAEPGIRQRGIGPDNLAYEANAMQPLVLASVVGVGHMDRERWHRILQAYQQLDLVPPTLTLNGFLYAPEPHGVTRRTLSWILAGLLGVMLLAAAAFVWITTLRRAVRARTSELRREHGQLLRAEREGRERERQLALVLEGTGVASWDWCIPTGELALDVTIDRLLGYEPQELPRRISTWFDHLHMDDRERLFAILQPFLDGASGVYDAEFRLTQKDGGWTWVDVTGRVTERGTDGRATRIQGILKDIDERKRSEVGLQQAKRLESLGLLAGGIAHDFNNLLTAVLGNLNLARLDLDSRSRAVARLQKAEDAVQQAANLTRQLLAYSGKGRLEVGAIDLNAAVSQMKDLLEVGLSRDILLETHLAPEPPFIEGDATQIQQVLLNLITNAAESIGLNPGQIRVETGTERLEPGASFLFPASVPLPAGDYAVLSITDTGAGMPQEVLAHIFDPFFTTKATGRGLGLSALMGIIQAHRGGIRITSSPGKGSAFHLFFPLRAAGAPPSRSSEATPEGELHGEVLLADDEPGILEASRALLEALGFTVLTAEDGEEAISSFLEHLDRICLVILDQTMPRMSGTDTFRAIRRLKPELPVILTSGFSEEEVGDVLQAEGLNGFLQKPYQLKDLERVVRKVLSR